MKTKTALDSFHDRPQCGFARPEAENSGLKRSGTSLVYFSFYAPYALEAFVAGTFNNWDVTEFRLRKDAEGIWRGLFPLPSGEHEYRFYIDGKWTHDTQSFDQIPNPFGGTNLHLTVD